MGHGDMNPSVASSKSSGLVKFLKDSTASLSDQTDLRKHDMQTIWGLLETQTFSGNG